MITIYHDDYDGHAAGSIVKEAYPSTKMYATNYGRPFPWEEIGGGEIVYLLDYSLQPYEDMLRLMNLARLIWIDHHKSAIAEAKKHKFPNTYVVAEGVAGCELTWKHIHPDNESHPGRA